jgi:hypothetical protein
MSQPTPDGRSPGGESAQDHVEPDPTTNSTMDRRAFDAVLRATLDSDAADQRVTAEEVAALGEVARRHGNVPLAYDPIAVDLVEAIIQVNYGHMKRPPEIWRSTAVRIAAVLFESPAARARLENLWARLLETNAHPGADA